MSWIFYLLLCHVTNPLTAPKAATLTADLKLGGEEADEAQIFSATTSLAGLPDGSLYVMDSGNFQVKVFAPDGSLRHTFGRKGPGPGEFSEPVALALNGKGQVMVFDTGTHKIVLFEADGRFLREIRFASGIHGVYQPVGSAGGGVALTCFKIDSQMQMGYQQILLDEAMSETAVFRKAALPPLEWEKADNPNFWVDFLRSQLGVVAKGWPYQARVGERLVLMHSAEYEGKMVDGAGKEVGSFSKTFKPRPIDDAGREAMFEPMWQNLASNPALSANMGIGVFRKALAGMESEMLRMPPVAGVAPLGTGFAVLANYNPLTREGSIDVFDGDGRLKAQGAYQGGYEFFTGAGDYLFSAGADEDDYLVVERFKVSY